MEQPIYQPADVNPSDLYLGLAMDAAKAIMLSLESFRDPVANLPMLHPRVSVTPVGSDSSGYVEYEVVAEFRVG